MTNSAIYFCFIFLSCFPKVLSIALLSSYPFLTYLKGSILLIVTDLASALKNVLSVCVLWTKITCTTTYYYVIGLFVILSFSRLWKLQISIATGLFLLQNRAVVNICYVLRVFFCGFSRYFIQFFISDIRSALTSTNIKEELRMEFRWASYLSSKHWVLLQLERCKLTFRHAIYIRWFDDHVVLNADVIEFLRNMLFLVANCKGQREYIWRCVVLLVCFVASP